MIPPLNLLKKKKHLLETQRNVMPFICKDPNFQNFYLVSCQEVQLFLNKSDVTGSQTHRQTDRRIFAGLSNLLSGMSLCADKGMLAERS